MYQAESLKYSFEQRSCPKGRFSVFSLVKSGQAIRSKNTLLSSAVALKEDFSRIWVYPVLAGRFQNSVLFCYNFARVKCVVVLVQNICWRMPESSVSDFVKMLSDKITASVMPFPFVLKGKQG